MKFPYASYIINLLRIDQPLEVTTTEYYDNELSTLILRGRFIFNEALKNYQLNSITKGITISEQPPDLIHGGECSALELVFLVTSCISKDPELWADFIPKIMPNNVPEFESSEEEKAYSLEFSLMKICCTISKLGKNVKFMYESLDEDNNGSLSSDEIINGLREKF